MLTGGYYNTGTVSVAAGATAVTGAGTDWAGTIRAGDILWIAGVSCRIAAVTAAGALTLAYPWPGPAASAKAYEIWRQPAEISIGEQLRGLIDLLGSGNAAALAALEGAPRKLPVFTGGGTMGLADLTDAARAVLALPGAAGAKIPVVTGAGTAALRDIVGAVGQSGGVPNGAIVEAGSNSGGAYWRFAGGFQVCVIAERSVAHNGADANQLRGSWSYALPFAAVPAVFWSLNPARSTGTTVDRLRLGNIWTEASVTGVNLYGTRQQSAPAWAAGDVLSGIDLLAVGRWHA